MISVTHYMTARARCWRTSRRAAISARPAMCRRPTRSRSSTTLFMDMSELGVEHAGGE